MSKRKSLKHPCGYVFFFFSYLGDRTVGILLVIVRRQINIILSRESLCCLLIQKEELDHLATNKNQPLISVEDLSRAIKKLYDASREVFLLVVRFFPSLKNSILNSSSIRSLVDEEPLCGYATLKVPFVLHLYFYLFIYYYNCYFFTHDLALALHA